MINEPNKGGFMRFHHNNIGKHSTTRRSEVRNRRSVTGRRVRLTILGVAVVFSIASFAAMANFQGATVYARDFNAEIKALQNQINDYNKRADERCRLRRIPCKARLMSYRTARIKFRPRLI